MEIYNLVSMSDIAGSLEATAKPFLSRAAAVAQMHKEYRETLVGWASILDTTGNNCTYKIDDNGARIIMDDSYTSWHIEGYILPLAETPKAPASVAKNVTANNDEGGLTPYVVHIEENYAQTIIVYAEDMEIAENAADYLCETGEVGLGRNCYQGRACHCLDKASENDLKSIRRVFEADAALCEEMMKRRF